MNNNHYWVKKDIRAKEAIEHTNLMESSYSKEINNSINNTIIYTNSNVNSFPERVNKKDISVIIAPTDTVSAIFQYTSDQDGKIAALNFASYKHPGGMFIKGSSAQEESLCHASFLYNVLKEFEDGYYKENRKNLNRSLYTNKALYSPNIKFFNKASNQEKDIDVITCAAPNYRAAKCHTNAIEPWENGKALKDRIEFVLKVAGTSNIDTLIIGAFGCGIFGQNSYTVSRLFSSYLKSYNYGFKKIIIAVPDELKIKDFKQNFFNS